ncbi:unnamed protein product [Adineta steineri]|uniref:Uncharacterized protein n=1 Tax=Adineta steineri TaxID=433720 RepID=A0A820D9N2_9BILA|nr:unnamed protein product [Adineta steineri]
MLTKHYFHIISISKNVSNNIHVGLPPNYSAHQHVCITLFWTNRLRCFQFPLSIINAVRDAINASWGNPWLRSGDESIPSRVVILHILSALHSNGWHL